MYYSEFDRVSRIEKLLEKLAYLSVALDFFVALATYFVSRGAAFSNQMLVLSGYLMLIEVALAAVLFAAMIAMRHYRKVMEVISLHTFRNRYHNESLAWKVVSVIKRILTLDI